MMAERSQTLVTSFEQAVAEFVGTVEALSEKQWRAQCPDEQRTVGVLARHVAAAIPYEMAIFLDIARGHQPETITRTQLAEMNARDAEAWAGCSQDETLALMRSNATEAAAELLLLREEQLARTGTYIADLPEVWTVEQWLERVLIGHIHEHLDSIRAAVAPVDTR